MGGTDGNLGPEATQTQFMPHFDPPGYGHRLSRTEPGKVKDGCDTGICRRGSGGPQRGKPARVRASRGCALRPPAQRPRSRGTQPALLACGGDSIARPPLSTPSRPHRLDSPDKRL